MNFDAHYFCLSFLSSLEANQKERMEIGQFLPLENYLDCTLHAKHLIGSISVDLGSIPIRVSLVLFNFQYNCTYN